MSALYQQLNKALRDSGPALPTMLIDLDSVDYNLDQLRQSYPDSSQLRLVVKSLPSLPLLDYLVERSGIRKLMLFHEPFLLQVAEHYGSKLGLLLGKPMPIATARHFYQHLNSNSEFNSTKQLSWLIDTVDRLHQYLQMAQELKLKLRVNLEIDIGLHRGGFREMEELRQALRLIESKPDLLEFSGFMGYDAHIPGIPALIQSPEKSLEKSDRLYRRCTDLVQSEFPSVWNEILILNGAGSQTLNLHESGRSSINDVAVGSALLKPTHFDVSSLENYRPACFIATPILKKFHGTRLPFLESGLNALSSLKPGLKYSYFIYGGHWKADFCYPVDAQTNQIFGPSTNQSMINSSSGDLEVDDFMFLRPIQSEFVLLQFGALQPFRGSTLLDRWPVLSNDVR